MKDALIIMMKNAVPGRVKTRLAASIGDADALRIYQALLEQTQKVTADIAADKYIFYDSVVERNDIFPNDRYKKYTQCSGDLGTRMDYAFSIPFKNEYRRVVLIGADCYALETRHIADAFEALNTNDFVLGPAKDGGYYLLAMKKWNRWIFKNKSWSTPALFSETLDEIKGNNSSVFLLEELNDIDTREDLQGTDLQLLIAGK